MNFVLESKIILESFLSFLFFSLHLFVGVHLVLLYISTYIHVPQPLYNLIRYNTVLDIASLSTRYPNLMAFEVHFP